MDDATKKQNIRRDILLVIMLLVLSLAAYVCMRLFAAAGGEAVVYIDGEAVGRYPLSQDTEVTFSGYDEGSNIVTISEGMAFVTDADCPDRLCVKSPGIRFEGESIVCLPHRLAVVIEGGAESGVDIP